MTVTRSMAPSKLHLLCVCASTTQLPFLSTKSFHEQGPKFWKKKEKKKGWLHRVTVNRYETKLSQTWPNNKAETLCRQRLGWSGLFIGSLWGLLTDTHICLTHTAIIKELAVSMKTDKEVNILYIITSKIWLIALKKKREKSRSNDGSWRDRAFFLVVTMVTASFKQEWFLLAMRTGSPFTNIFPLIWLFVLPLFCATWVYTLKGILWIIHLGNGLKVIKSNSGININYQLWETEIGSNALAFCSVQLFFFVVCTTCGQKYWKYEQKPARASACIPLFEKFLHVPYTFLTT